MPPKGSESPPGAAAGADGDGGGAILSSSDPQLEAALRAVLDIVFRQHPLLGNQILHLAAELQRLGTHRVVEEHIARHRRVEGRRGGLDEAPGDSVPGASERRERTQ